MNEEEYFLSLCQQAYHIYVQYRWGNKGREIAGHGYAMTCAKDVMVNKVGVTEEYWDEIDDVLIHEYLVDR